MINDKITVVLKDLAELRQKLKEVKKDIKTEEKIVNEDYLELKKTIKDLRGQVKYMEEEKIEELKADEFYNNLRELKLSTEEKIAQHNEELFKLIDQLPQKFHEMEVDTEVGPIRVQMQPEMKLYLNGKEEKKKN